MALAVDTLKSREEWKEIITKGIFAYYGQVKRKQITPLKRKDNSFQKRKKESKF